MVDRPTLAWEEKLFFYVLDCGVVAGQDGRLPMPTYTDMSWTGASDLGSLFGPFWAALEGRVRRRLF